MSIFAAGYPASAAHSCASSGPTDAVEETVNPGSSELSYSAGNDRYQYVWKTEKSWAGECRTLLVKLADGTLHTADDPTCRAHAAPPPAAAPACSPDC